MKPTKQAIALYCEARGDARKFIDEMMRIGKTFAYAEKQYYACKNFHITGTHNENQRP